MPELKIPPLSAAADAPTPVIVMVQTPSPSEFKVAGPLPLPFPNLLANPGRARSRLTSSERKSLGVK